MNIENLDLEITRRCTLNCEHCFRGDSQNINMSIESLVNIFSSVNKIETLLITGGEPFIAVNELEKMIELIVNNNVKIREIRIVTNGTVLSSRVLKILKDLSSISNLVLKISYDIFHQLELEKRNLKQKRDKNVEFLKENFGAEECGFENIKSTYEIGLQPLGRVKKLNIERLNEINSYTINKYKIMSFVTWQKSHCILENNQVYGDLYIDVNGNVVNYGVSFEDEDNYSAGLETNINKNGFINAINNYINKEKISEDQHVSQLK